MTSARRVSLASVYSGRSSISVSASIWTMPLGAVETTTRRISCSAKAGAVSIWRSSGGMSPRGTCCWPVVATTSPAVSGFIPKLRFSALAEPCRRRFFCAGAKTTRCAGLESALRISTRSPDAELGIGALQAVEPDDLELLVLGIGADRAGRRWRACRPARSRRPRRGRARSSPRAAAGRCRARYPRAASSRPEGGAACVRRRPLQTSPRRSASHRRAGRAVKPRL